MDIVKLLRRVTPAGRVLIAVTVAVGIAAVVFQRQAAYIAVAVVCVCWIGVYWLSDPLGRKMRGDDPARDSVSWRDREI